MVALASTVFLGGDVLHFQMLEWMPHFLVDILREVAKQHMDKYSINCEPFGAAL